MMTGVLRVGVLGAGPVAQAIHLPTIARRRDCAVSRVMDVDAGLAEAVAARAGARWTTDEAELIGADDVDIVVVGSPPQHHARQVEAACRAAKLAVLCEKPLATTTEEAQRLAGVSEQTGVPVLVGAMHVFDPGWRAAHTDWTRSGARPHTILSRVLLPPNPRFEDAASTVIRGRRATAAPASDPATALRNGVLGLAVHDLPLIRRLVGPIGSVTTTAASLVHPFGYVIDLMLDDVAVRLTAVSPVPWRPDWSLEAVGDDARLEVVFPPSYVHAGGASAVIRAGSRTIVHTAPPENGYVGEWDAVVAAARGDAAWEGASLEDAVADLALASLVADAASAMLEPSPEGAGR